MGDTTFHIPPPCEADIVIKHVDKDVVVVSKPAGLLSVPGRVVKDCVLSRLAAEYPDVTVVHRLDLDTSGLLVLARSSRAVSELNRQFRERLVDKRYCAVVDGRMADDSGTVELALSPDPNNRPRQRVDMQHGKAAVTRFSVLARQGDTTRIALNPVTGRSHQLRIHMAEIGHPILGCDLYAPEAVLEKAERLLLHAEGLSFEHPGLARRLQFSDEVPF